MSPIFQILGEKNVLSSIFDDIVINHKVVERSERQNDLGKEQIIYLKNDFELLKGWTQPIIIYI